MSTPSTLLFDSGDATLYDVVTAQPGPAGALPLEPADLTARPSGDVFGWTQDVGMGWQPAELKRPEVLILSTQGGVREPDGTPLALGYHTGHWEVGLLVRAAAEQLRASQLIPFAAFVTDPCDGRTQGTTGMMDSLPYRNDAALVLGRLVRSLPTGRAVIGIATCDKGLPAMLMTLAACRDLATVAVPGGVTLPPTNGVDAGTAQTIGARYSYGTMTLEEAAELGCRACASPGGGCQFLGTAATSQVVAEALGLTVPHAALAPSGQPIWTDVARRSARAAASMIRHHHTTSAIVTDAAIRNAMTVHAAVGGSTNLLLHVPAIAHAAGLRRPTVDDWREVNHSVPRLVDVLPNGPHPTIRVYLAGGVPEVMLHLRRGGLLDTSARTVTGATLDEVLDWWEASPRRQALRARLRDADGVDPDDVIMSPDRARSRGLVSTVCFVGGNLAPQGAVIKATAIDAKAVGRDGVFRLTGPARVFTTERAAIAAIKSRGDDRIRSGEVLVLIGRGPLGAGMEEVYQVTSALKYLDGGSTVALLTDARFSGVSTGPCVGHIGPEALAGGPIGRLRDGDRIRVIVDRTRLDASIDLVEPGPNGDDVPSTALLSTRTPHPALAPDPALPDATRLWAALQNVSGGVWGGCVYDVDSVVAALKKD